MNKKIMEYFKRLQTFIRKLFRKQKTQKKRHGAASHFLRYHAVPSGKSRRRRFVCHTYADKDERSVLIRHMHPMSDLFSALRGYSTKTHSFRPDLLGEKPAGKLCARINLNSSPELLKRGVETVCPA